MNKYNEALEEVLENGGYKCKHLFIISVEENEKQYYRRIKDAKQKTKRIIK